RALRRSPKGQATPARVIHAEAVGLLTVFLDSQVAGALGPDGLALFQTHSDPKVGEGLLEHRPLAGKITAAHRLEIGFEVWVDGLGEPAPRAVGAHDEL